MISLSLAYLQCVPCERRFLRTEPIKPLNDAYHDRSFIEGNTLGFCFASTLESVFCCRRMCAHPTAFILILNGGVCLPRNKKDVEKNIDHKNNPTNQ